MIGQKNHSIKGGKIRDKGHSDLVPKNLRGILLNTFSYTYTYIQSTPYVQSIYVSMKKGIVHGGEVLFLCTRN